MNLSHSLPIDVVTATFNNVAYFVSHIDRIFYLNNFHYVFVERSKTHKNTLSYTHTLSGWKTVRILTDAKNFVEANKQNAERTRMIDFVYPSRRCSACVCNGFDRFVFLHTRNDFTRTA